MRALLASTAVIVALAMHPDHAPAQEIARVRCDSAAMTVAGRPLPRAGSGDWSNWVALTGCGSRGAAVLAGALQTHVVRVEKDIARVDLLTGLLDGWYAPQLITTYEGVAAANDATPALRLRAMWLLAGLFEPSVDVAGPLQSYAVHTCSAYGRTTTLRDAPSSLPPGASDGVRGAFAAVGADKSAPESVRNTARCWSSVVAGQVVATEPERQAAPAVSRYDSAWVCTWCANARAPSSIAGMPDWSYGGMPTTYQSPNQLGYPGAYDAYGNVVPYPAVYPYGYYPYGYPLIVSGPMRPFVRAPGLLAPPIGVGAGGRPPLRPPPPARPKP